MTLRQALENNPAAAAQISQPTRWRYGRGMFPKSILWFFNNPEMFDAARRQYLAEQSTDTSLAATAATPATEEDDERLPFQP